MNEVVDSNSNADNTPEESCEKELELSVLEQLTALSKKVDELSIKVDKLSSVKLDSDVCGVIQETPKKKGKLTFFTEVLFYVALVALVVGAFLVRASSNGNPITFAGYSAFTVLTSSMESDYPKGSLIVTKSVDPKTLRIGDDITFMSGPNSTTTHRIIGITEQYLETGERAFETKGVMNSQPDKNPVPAVNIVGKVVFHSEVLGRIATFSKANWPFLLFIFIVIAILFAVLKWVFKNDTPKAKSNANAQPHPSDIDAES